MRKCEECVWNILTGPKVFENVNMYVVANKLGKIAITKKKETQIINRKALVLSKFKNYGAEKEKKRLMLAKSRSKKGKAEDPMKKDKAFLKKLVSEFNPPASSKSR